MSVNKVILVGRLGGDPETKTVGQNTLTNFSLATDKQWVDRDGQRQKKTEWHRVVTWGKVAENCGKYLSKGRQVYVEGEIQTRSWDDKEGKKQYMTEIVANTIQFLGDNPNKNSSNNSRVTSDFGQEPRFNAEEPIPF